MPPSPDKANFKMSLYVQTNKQTKNHKIEKETKDKTNKKTVTHTKQQTKT